ncbi:MAG: AI-2E family transporter [Bacteroidota bacterium]|nr:AI-2E family transporter [Bacteroidota bacterium]
MIINSTSLLKKLLVVFLLFLGVYLAKKILIPLSIAGLFAMLFLPFCKWMEGKKLPRALAAFICLLTLVSVISAVFAMLAWQISGLTGDLEIIKQRSVEAGISIQEFIFDQIGISLEKQDKVLSTQIPFFSGILQNVAGSISSILTNFVLILVYVLFLLYYRGHIKQFLLRFASPSQKNEMEKVIYRVAHVSQQYLLGLSKMIFCLWVMYGIGFSIIGVKNALFFAILCGVLEIVPFVGNITGTTITIFVSLVQGASLPMLLGIAGIYAVTQFIQGWVLEPLILGPQVKINPLFTIIALVVGGSVWGLSGIFLAIPLMAMFKIVCDHIEPLKPYGFLIGEVPKKNPGFIKKITKWQK